MNRAKFYLLIAAIIFVPFISLSQPNAEAKQKTPMMGWASWNNFRAKINEDIIKAQTDALIGKRLNQFGYNFINIDDGYFGGRDRDRKSVV